MSEDYVIGVDLGGTKISAALVGRNGKTSDILLRSSSFNNGIDSVFNSLVKIINDVRESGKDHNIRGIGIAASGRIDNESGAVVGGVALCDGYIGFPLKEKITEKFNIPVCVLNDANAAAFAEYKIGAGKSSRRLLCITVGTGIGGGIVINGELFTGRGNAGEIGHLIIVKDGRICSCGQSGCLEKYVSRKIMAQEISIDLYPEKARNSPVISTEEIIEMIKDKNPVALKIFNRQMEYLATGIRNVVNTIDPDLILISGQLSNLGNILLTSLKKNLPRGLNLEIAGLGSHAGLSGAALYTFSTIPLRTSQE
jgi:glucokinase